MSKEITPLQALNELRNNYVPVFHSRRMGKQQVVKSFAIIEKELEALKIIRKKFVNIVRLINSNNVDEYNKTHYDDLSLTKEEFDILKEVLL